MRFCLVPKTPTEASDFFSLIFVFLLLCAHSLSAALPERFYLGAKVEPGKEFRATEQKAQQRITNIERTWQQKEPTLLRPAVKQDELEDDWFALLDVAPKKSGII